MAKPVIRTWFVLFAGAAVLLGPAVRASRQQPPQPSFRTRVTIVPLDVRVLGRDGKPVTDLRQEDFTVLEDGVPQAIRHFSKEQPGSDPAPAPDAPELPGPDAATMKPPNRRVFLLVAGRGRMDGPSKELDALVEFVRTKLLSRDYVALLSYNRATPFTTDHARIVAVLERFRKRQTSIEADLAHHFSGLQAVYGAKQIPPRIQAEIDAVFTEPGGPAPRSVPPAQIADERRIRVDQRRTGDELLRAEILAQREAAGLGALPDPAATATAERLDLSFDDYVAMQAELIQDVANLYSAISYLRYLEGEKHLVFVTPKGIALPRQDDNRSLAAVAADARIALDIIYTGGTVGPAPPRTVLTANGPVFQMSPIPSSAAVFQQTFTMQDLRLMSDITGGQFTAFRSAASAFTRIDTSTRFHYLLGYYPSNATVDGRFRRVTVQVNRRGVTVFNRRGYFARGDVILERRDYIAHLRVTAAAAYAEDLHDIAVTLAPPVVNSTPLSLEVAGNVRSPRVTFTDVNGRKAATLDVLVICADDRKRVVGQLQRVVRLNLTPESFAAFQRDGAGLNVRVPVTAKPTYVKVIVYDYGADILGSAVSRVQ